MPHMRVEAANAVARARSDLDRALARLELLEADDRQRVSYSVHALNNYLMVVSTTLQLLQTRLVEAEDPDVRRWLGALRQATNLMMSTARGVLTVVPELPPLLLEPVLLSEIAEGVCDAYADAADAKHIGIVFDSAADTDNVLTDRVAAAAVLDNLVSNAIKYSSPGTTISVKVDAQVDEAFCAVCDCGPGLTDADQLKLFQRGVRLSPQPTAAEPSTGYGLAIAHDLTKALGGRLWCKSDVGKGSCFTFALPLVKTEGEDAHGELLRPWPREVRVSMK